MNREFTYTNNNYNNSLYLPNPQNQINRFQQGFQMPSQSMKNQSESDLAIFNGQQPVRDFYHPHQKAYNNNLLPIPQRIGKNSTPKAFPIIYNAYNDGGAQHQFKLQALNSNQASRNLVRNHPNEQDPFNQKNYSNLSGKQHHEETPQSIQFHTFQHIPPENELRTAKFLNLPENISPEGYLISSPTEHYWPPQTHFENKQYISPKIYNAQPPQPSPAEFSSIRNGSRTVQRLNIPTSPTSKVIIHQQLPPKFVNYSQERTKVIQIPQQQYERYVNHFEKCRLKQEQNSVLKSKAQQLSQKQQFYWQQNMNLKQENKRLREIVNHFQKRQKQLLCERQEQRQTFQQQIVKYRDSALEQFSLLMQRYRLQIQKKK